MAATLVTQFNDALDDDQNIANALVAFMSHVAMTHSSSLLSAATDTAPLMKEYPVRDNVDHRHHDDKNNNCPRPIAGGGDEDYYRTLTTMGTTMAATTRRHPSRGKRRTMMTSTMMLERMKVVVPPQWHLRGISEGLVMTTFATAMTVGNNDAAGKKNKNMWPMCSFFECKNYVKQW